MDLFIVFSAAIACHVYVYYIILIVDLGAHFSTLVFTYLTSLQLDF